MKIESIFSRQNRRFLILLAVIFLAAFAFRSVVIWQNHPIELCCDEPEYVALAQYLIKSGEFVTSDLIPTLGQGGKTGEATAFRSPVFPVFIAGHFLIFGENLLYLRISMIFFSALICLPLGYIGLRTGGEKVGLVSAAIWAIYPTSLISWYSSERILTDGIGAFFLVAAFAFIISFYRNLKIWKIVLAGLFMGLAILSRGYLLFIFPLCVLFLLVLKKYRLPKPLILFCLVVSFILGGWVLRNALVMGKPLLSTQTEHFYLGNNLWARGSFNGDIFTLGWDAPQYRAVLDKYPNALEMSEMERSEMWNEMAIASVKENPARVPWLLWRKTAIFFLPLIDWHLDYYKYHYLFGLLMLFSAVGFWLKRKDAVLPMMILLSLPMLGIYISTLLLYASDRYRSTGEPFVVVLGVVGFFALLEYFKEKKVV